MQHLIKDYFFVPVPEDAVVVELTYSGDKIVFWFDGYCEERELDGSYTFICTSTQATEEECRGVVSANATIHNTWFRDYCYKMGSKKPDTIFQFDTALASFQSLLKSKGITSNCAIIRKLDDGSKAINSDLPLLP